MGVRIPHHAELADDALVVGLAVEDGDAATAFVRRFQAKVYGLALAVTHDRARSPTTWPRKRSCGRGVPPPTYDGRLGTVAAWLLTITRNAAIDAVRARRSEPADDEELDRLMQATFAGGSSDVTARDATANVEAGQVLDRLRQVPPDQARAVILAVFGGCTAEEISRRDGIPLGTAKTCIRSGLLRLRAGAAEKKTGGEGDAGG